jgi:putative hydrolase of the HAD superfamily/5'-nucleotidase
MSQRFLDRYKVILLDMNSTFMFGEDRFGAEEDFFATYRHLGGRRLDAATVDNAIRRCYDGMARDYVDPARVDDFPSLAEGLQRYAQAAADDIPLLSAVFAHHELGRVPAEHAACLHRLSRTHTLGVVSNIWATKGPWLAEFQRAGIHDLMRTVVFSSDGRSIKPSPRLLRAAVECVDTPLSDILFVGDNLRVDVAPAKAYGMDAVWLDPQGRSHALADRTLPSLLSLEAQV